MSFRFETEQWQSACVAFDNGEYETSIKMFINIADNSKIHFNIGLIFAIADEHDRAK
ncbi:Putative Oxidoreductase [Rhizopus microsporus]|nr:Putative Oxidoreductase [Rhizopus microsporus]